MSGPNERCLVSLSGKRGSAVAAALLKSQGHTLEAVHFKRKGMMTRCTEANVEEAKKIALKLDLPLTIVDVQSAFEDRVWDRYIHERVSLRDLDPCIPCTQDIGFAYLFATADELKCKQVATGHFTQVVESAGTGVFRALKAADTSIDQSYYFFGLNQERLSRLLTPLGGLTLNQVNKMAVQLDLGEQTGRAAKIKNGECLRCDPGMVQTIEKNVAHNLRMPGMIRTLEGNIVGQHDGLFKFRVGERPAATLSTQEKDFYWVVGFDYTQHSLLVGPESALMSRKVLLDRVNWIAQPDGLREQTCRAKAGLEKPESSCYVTLFENRSAHVEFGDPQRALAEGQAIVFYRGDELLGGGWIEKILK